MQIVLLRNGVFPVELHNGQSESQAVNQWRKKGDFSNEPLTFEEITSLNTWYAMHPEKVAGIEKKTSSIQFPLTIVGDETLIKQTLNKGLKSSTQKRSIKAKRHSSSSQRSIRLAEAEAGAIMMMLEIENI